MKTATAKDRNDLFEALANLTVVLTLVSAILLS